MKKVLILILTLILSVMAFAGCSESVSPLKNTDGEINLASNGSFLVEKGDYVYFINGRVAVSKNNEFGKPTKGALVRIKKSDLQDTKNAKTEVVIPKLMISGSYKTGVYMYGDYIYYATPSTVKDKQGKIKYDESEYNKFNLKTGKAGSPIAYSTDDSVEYRYVERDGKVYLAFTFTKTKDETTEKFFKVYNATDNKLVYTSPAYTEMLMPEDNSSSIFFTVYSEGLKEDEKASFQDMYRYNVGDKEAQIVLCGAGSDGLKYNNRDEYAKEENKHLLTDESGVEGVTITLIKNTGKLLIYKVKNLNTTNSYTFYYGVELVSEDCTFKDKVNLGSSVSTSTDKAFTSTSIYLALDKVLYIEGSEGSEAGLIEFNYKEANKGIAQGKTLITSKCKGYSILEIQGDYMYLADTANGIYYRCDYTSENPEVNKINPISMETPTEWYAPTIIDNKYFVGLIDGNYYKEYVFVVDMSLIDAEKEDGEDKTPYEKYLDKYSDITNATREDMLSLLDTRIGKITSGDKKAVDKLIDEDYPEDDDNE